MQLSRQSGPTPSPTRDCVGKDPGLPSSLATRPARAVTSSHTATLPAPLRGACSSTLPLPQQGEPRAQPFLLPLTQQVADVADGRAEEGTQRRGTSCCLWASHSPLNPARLQPPPGSGPCQTGPPRADRHLRAGGTTEAPGARPELALQTAQGGLGAGSRGPGVMRPLDTKSRWAPFLVKFNQDLYPCQQKRQGTRGPRQNPSCPQPWGLRRPRPQLVLTPLTPHGKQTSPFWGGLKRVFKYNSMKI